jgi:hypothetical protein
MVCTSCPLTASLPFPQKPRDCRERKRSDPVPRRGSWASSRRTSGRSSRWAWTVGGGKRGLPIPGNLAISRRGAGTSLGGRETCCAEASLPPTPFNVANSLPRGEGQPPRSTPQRTFARRCPRVMRGIATRVVVPRAYRLSFHRTTQGRMIRIIRPLPRPS